jgi:hypothetical protein
VSDAFKTVFLIDDETGKDVEFEVIDGIEVDGERYLLVVPLEEGEDKDRAFILKDVSKNKNEAIYRLVDDEEFNKAAVYFIEDNDEYEIEF